jgi:hypothetical protein
MSERGQPVRFGRFWLDLDLWLRGWIAAQKLILASFVLGAHYLFRDLVTLLFSQDFRGWQKLVSVVEGVPILTLMAWLLVEAVRIFLPPPWGVELDLASHRKGKSDGSPPHV